MRYFRIMAAMLGLALVAIQAATFVGIGIGACLCAVCLEPSIPSGLTPWAASTLLGSAIGCVVCEALTHLCAWGSGTKF